MATKTCTHCGSTYDDTTTAPYPLAERQCFNCGTILTEERIAEIIASSDYPHPQKKPYS